MRTEILEQVGCRVANVGSGEEALEYYQKAEGVGLIILELGMPGMGGHKCLQKLLALNPDLKVLVASGYSPDAQLKDTLASSADGYLPKPFKLSNFLKTVRNVLDG